MDISHLIRTVREDKRLTQFEVAEKLKMERSNYARLESRGDKLTIEQLTKIAEALGVGVGELLGLDTPVAAINPNTSALEKRVVELEDRLKDKEYIIENKAEELVNIKKSAIGTLMEVEYVIAKSLSIGRINCYLLTTGKGLTEVFSHTISWEEENNIMADFDRSRSGQELVYDYVFPSMSSKTVIDNGRKVIRHGFEFTDQEQKQMLETMFLEHSEYALLVQHILYVIFVLKVSSQLPKYVFEEHKRRYNFNPI